MNRGPIILTIDEVEYLLDQLVRPFTQSVKHSTAFHTHRLRSLPRPRMTMICFKNFVSA
ncbi:hypothetical protein B0F90DRAFT_269333 [Multifurca ochricompacta]|uniref:Uncharacterized protein n=1 Tax=Multifurca ochricompacta TaxID=376703 RepID=A0AAD4M4V0_9AGAM|nr:hypothetical protein B0F90DRAFT_269333 [Multifurca ochricompacta]